MHEEKGMEICTKFNDASPQKLKIKIRKKKAIVLRIE